MPPSIRSLWNRLFPASRRRIPKRPSVRLNLEHLEDRTVPATGTSVISGTVLINADTSAIHSTVSGVDVTLSGTTEQGASVSTSATTDGNGAFTFANVLPGTYQMSAGSPSSYIATGSSATAAFSVGLGESITQDVVYQGGLSPNSISMRQFLTSTGSGEFPSDAGGNGSGTANDRENNIPTVLSALSDINVTVNSASTSINLAGHFTDPDMTDSQVTFNVVNGGTSYSFKVTMLDTVAPQTVSNFFNYVNSGAYDDIFFTRLVSGFVLQGGGSQLNADGTDITPVPTLPAVPNEFSASNSAYTLAMALSGGNINSATNQFFFNLGNNSASLDPQNFTVFGRVDDIDSIITLLTLSTTSTQNMSGTAVAAANPTVDMQNVPLSGYTGSSFPTDATLDNYMRIDSIVVDRRDEYLSYSATSSNPGLVSVSLQNEWLTLDYLPNQVGTATITIEVTDRFGATLVETFDVTVTPVAPEVTSVEIAPDNPADTTTLIASPVSNDPQGLPVSHTYQWLLNGNPISGETSATLTLDPNTVIVGDAFSVEVTPSDSLLTGTTFTSNATVVASVGPIVFGTPLIQSVTIAADDPSDATSLNSTVVSQQPASFAYQWYINGNPISGATESSFDLNSLLVVVGDVFTLDVTPSQGGLIGATVTSNSRTIVFTDPFVVV